MHDFVNINHLVFISVLQTIESFLNEWNKWTLPAIIHLSTLSFPSSKVLLEYKRTNCKCITYGMLAIMVFFLFFFRAFSMFALIAAVTLFPFFSLLPQQLKLLPVETPSGTHLGYIPSQHWNQFEGFFLWSVHCNRILSTFYSISNNVLTAWQSAGQRQLNTYLLSSAWTRQRTRNEFYYGGQLVRGERISTRSKLNVTLVQKKRCPF